jgi:hypothetical protein
MPLYHQLDPPDPQWFFAAPCGMSGKLLLCINKLLTATLKGGGDTVSSVLRCVHWLRLPRVGPQTLLKLTACCTPDSASEARRQCSEQRSLSLASCTRSGCQAAVVCGPSAGSSVTTLGGLPDGLGAWEQAAACVQFFGPWQVLAATLGLAK